MLKIIAPVVAFFVMVGAVIYFAISAKPIVEPKGDGTKLLSRTAAEGLSYKAPFEPFPRVSCDACRLSKLKAGIFSLSAFNVIELDNLVLNIPTNIFCRYEAVKLNSANDVVSDDAGRLIETLNMGPVLSMSNIPRNMKFSGVKINKLTINIMRGRELIPFLSVQSVKNSRKRIVLKDVVFNNNGTEEYSPEAELVLKPSPAIILPNEVVDLKAALRQMRCDGE